MGVKWLLRWHLAKGQVPGTQDLDYLVSILGRMHAVTDSRSSRSTLDDTTVTFMRQQPIGDPQLIVRGAPTMHSVGTVKLHDQPNRLYVVLRSDGEYRCTATTASMEQFLLKVLQYQPKAVAAFLTKRCRVGDFYVKVMAVQQRTTVSAGGYAGTAIEVEYRPVRHAEQAEPALREFVQILNGLVGDNPRGRLVMIAPDFKAYQGLTEAYSNLHAAIAYVEAFVQLTGNK